MNSQNNVILFHELNENIVTEIVNIFHNPTHKHHILIKSSKFTFDDGLYSQIYYITPLLELGIECTIFVSTKFICEGGKQILGITSPNAHKLARKYDYRAYATIEQLKDFEKKGGKIGNHGYDHYNFETYKHGIKATKKEVEYQCKMSSEFFQYNKFNVDSFAYPYNNVVPFYKLYLGEVGVTNFYGKERINITRLLDSSCFY